MPPEHLNRIPRTAFLSKNDITHVVQELYLNDDHGAQDFATLHLVEGVFDLV